MSSSWHQYLNRACDTFTLDIAEALNRVWHYGLISKFGSVGVNGDLLCLLHDYLRDRSLNVVVKGHISEEHLVSAGVPPGQRPWIAIMECLLQ